MIIQVASRQELGTFLGQSPSAGAEVRQGGSVTVRYSSGEPAEMPDWTGIRASNIENRINNFNARTGLNVTFRIVERPTSNPDEIGRVILTQPRPGAIETPNREIRFIVGVALG